MAPKVLVITGPTASGKTKLSIGLAKMYNGEIVGADSMQIYKYMDIGTAKPTEEEKQGIPHHVVDCISPFESYSVSRYIEDASAIVSDILSRGKLPIIVGGTGLYIDSLISGRDFLPDGDGAVRNKYSALYDELGGDKLLRRLGEFDPQSAEKLHSNDKKRIVRAFEVYELSGKTISAHNEETQSVPPRYDALKLALTFKKREVLYERINTRVDIMVENGLEEEVKKLFSMGLTSSHTAMQAIGYKEICDYLEGKCTFNDAVEQIKTGSRQYAKRQLSWLRRDSRVKWIMWDDIPDFALGLQDSTEFLREFGIIKPY